jgi:hypothetical protein
LLLSLPLLLSLLLSCHSERSEEPAFAPALVLAFVFAFAFLSVIPEGNLLLPNPGLVTGHDFSRAERAEKEMRGFSP